MSGPVVARRDERRTDFYHEYDVSDLGPGERLTITFEASVDDGATWIPAGSAIEIGPCLNRDGTPRTKGYLRTFAPWPDGVLARVRVERG